jgi:hypothetical protein
MMVNIYIRKEQPSDNAGCAWYIHVQRSIPNILFGRCAWYIHVQRSIPNILFGRSALYIHVQHSIPNILFGRCAWYIHVQRSIPNILFGRFGPTTSGILCRNAVAARGALHSETAAPMKRS